MNSLLIRFLVGAVLTLSSTFAAPAPGARQDLNPALRYYQALMVAPDLAATDRNYLFQREWMGEALPERFGKLLAGYNNEFAQVLEAARATVPCDWGIDMSPGPATLLPHLARCKGVSQAARLRVMWDLQHGEQAAARDDLLASLALARNTTRNGVLIALLVQIAMEHIVCTTVAENFGQFSPEALKQLAEGIKTAPPRGTVADAIPMEVASFVDWLEAGIAGLQKQNQGDDAKVMAAVEGLVSGLEGGNEAPKKAGQPSFFQRLQTAAGGQSSGVVKLLRDARTFYPRLSKIMNLPAGEYSAEADALNKDIRESQNPFVPELFGAWDKCRQREFAALVQLAMVDAALQYKLHGEAGLRSVVDPTAQAPFAMERFLLDGVDRGFKLSSSYAGRGFRESMIFVESKGAPFRVSGNNVGQAISAAGAAK